MADSPVLPGLPFEDDARSPRPPRGIFGEFVGATPKYAVNTQEEGRDWRDQMARLFVQLGDSEYRKFIDSLPAETQPLANVLAGSNVAVGGAKGGTGYVDFLLQRASHNLQEKVEVVELLSDNYVAYFFGQAAPTFSYSGTLLNTRQDDQTLNMVRLYRDVLRGTQLARRHKVVRLRYDGLIVTGALLNLTWDLQAENEMACPFSFQLLVKELTLLPSVDYGLVSLSTPFDPDNLLGDGAVQSLDTQVRPVRLTAAPPRRKA